MPATCKPNRYLLNKMKDKGQASKKINGRRRVKDYAVIAFGQLDPIVPEYVSSRFFNYESQIYYLNQPGLWFCPLPLKSHFKLVAGGGGGGVHSSILISFHRLCF